MLKLIPVIAMYASALGFFGNALHQLVNLKDPAAATESFLKALGAAGIGGAVHYNTNATVATGATVAAVEQKATQLQDTAATIASNTNAIARKV